MLAFTEIKDLNKSSYHLYKSRKRIIHESIWSKVFIIDKRLILNIEKASSIYLTGISYLTNQPTKELLTPNEQIVRCSNIWWYQNIYFKNDNKQLRELFEEGYLEIYKKSI